MSKSRPDIDPDWDAADNTQARIAILAERQRQQSAAIAEHDGALGRFAAELGAISATLARLDGAARAARWLLPLFGAGTVATVAATVAIVVHWR